MEERPGCAGARANAGGVWGGISGPQAERAIEERPGCEVRGRNADPARHMVGLETDDVTADWKRLKAAEVEFVEDPRDYGNVMLAT